MVKEYFDGETPNPDLWISDGLSFRLVAFLTNKLSAYRGIIQCAWPNVEKDDAKLVNIWPSQASRAKGRTGRIQVKPGRAFAKLFPHLDNVQLSKLVDEYKKEFYPKEFTIHSGKTREDFARVYSMDCADYQNSAKYKSLARSCMQKVFWGHLHPCEAYASGDFTLFWVLEGDKLAARVVAYDERAAPIYACSDAAGDALAGQLENFGIEHDSSNDAFDGARLLHITRHGNTVAPYLDLESACEASSCGKYLVIGSGNIACNNTTGYADDDSTCCEACGDSVREDEVFVGPYGDGSYCESCYNDRFTMCEGCESSVDVNDVITVYYLSARNNRNSRCLCEGCLDDTVVTDADETWETDDCTTIHSGEWVDNLTLKSDYTLCDMESEYYSNNDVRETESDGSVNIFYLRGHGFEVNESGVWYDPQLKLNLEGDSE